MNRFLKTHPFAMFVYFLAVICVPMFCDNPVLKIISLMGAVSYSLYLSKCREILSQFCFYATLFLLISITNPIFVHNGKTPLFFMNGNPVTLEALISGASIAITIISVILWFSCVTKVMTSDKFYFLFSKISPKLALVFSTAITYLPRLKKSYNETEKAQKTLGIYSQTSRFDRLKLKLKTMSSVISQSAENSIEISTSMNSRGYGVKKRTSYCVVKVTFCDVAIVLFSLGVVLLQVLFAIKGITFFEFYPTLTKMNFEIHSIIAYVLYMMLCFVPVITELTESIKWKFLVSKI